MAAPTLTYTLTNATTADADQVMQNLNDLLDGISDGTKDLSISALTVAGTGTFNGAVTLGNATGDDITVTGRFASDLDPKTAATNDFGDATQTWRALYLDNTTTDGGAVYFDGGTTEYIKSNAAGTILTIGGFTSGTEILGTSAANEPTAGYVGEYITGSPGGDVTPAASGSNVNITSISLTAGDWDVYGSVMFAGGTISGLTEIDYGISTTSGGFDSTTAESLQVIFTTNTGTHRDSCLMRRILISSTTTVYLVGQLTYTTLGSAVFKSGSVLRARRRR